MKQIIWSSEDRLDDNARERYQEFQREVQDDNTYIVSDEEWTDEVYGYLDDERHNLNKHIDGVIMVFADLGLWYGRRQGYQILGSNIADILHSQCDEVEWYGDGYNIRGRMIHHDGTNHVFVSYSQKQGRCGTHCRQNLQWGNRRGRFSPENPFTLSVCRRCLRLEDHKPKKRPRENDKHGNGCRSRLWDVLRHIPFILHERPFCGPGNLF